VSRRAPSGRSTGRSARAPEEPRPGHAAARPRPTVEPEINIVNLSDSEYQLLTAVRELGQGQIEVVVHSSRIVQITRSQRLPVAPRAARP